MKVVGSVLAFDDADACHFNTHDVSEVFLGSDRVWWETVVKNRTFQQEVVTRADYFLRLSASGGVYDKPVDPDGSIAVAIIDEGGGKFMVDIWLAKSGKWVRLDGPGSGLGATFGPFASGEGDASNVYVRGFNYPSGTMLLGDPMQTGKATDLAFGDDGTLNTEHGPEGSYVLPAGTGHTNIIGWWYDGGTSDDVFINEVAS